MKIVVKPNEEAVIFKDSKPVEFLEPGVYYKFFPFRHVEVFSFSKMERVLNIINQEVLTKDSISLRFSFYYAYKITELDKLIQNFPLSDNSSSVIYYLESKLNTLIKVEIRKSFSGLTILELNENRNSIFDGMTDILNSEFEPLGVRINSISPIDFSFPKKIQDIFTNLLESKLRVQADLENARTQVATARTLKNASEIIKDNENIKFFQYLETMTKIASKGNHSFVMGTDFLKNIR